MNETSHLDSKLSSLLITSAVSNDLSTIKQLLTFKNLEINKLDQTKTNALTYAACGGNLEIVKELLKNGARLGEKEAKLVSLMAISNGHEAIGKLILDSSINGDPASEYQSEGAGTDYPQTRNGKYDFNDTNMSIGGSINWKMTKTMGLEHCVLPTIEEEDESSDQASTSTSESHLTYVDEEGNADVESDQENDIDTLKRSVQPFDPNTLAVMNAEMIAFDYPSKTPQFLQMAIQRLVPSKKQFYPLGASILYLSACYCKTISSEAVDEFLSIGLETIRNWVKILNDVRTTCYWISNCLQLLVFLKKGLMEETIRIQCLLTDFIQESLEGIVTLVTTELSLLLKPCLIDFLNPSLLSWMGLDNPSPQMVIDVLYQYHSTFSTSLPTGIISQLLDKITKFMSRSLLDHLKCNPSLCCRVKAQTFHEAAAPLTSYLRSVGGDLKGYTDYLLYVQFVSGFQDLKGYAYLMDLVVVTDEMVTFVCKNYHNESGEAHFRLSAQDMKRGMQIINSEGFRLDTGRGSELWNVEPKVPKQARDMVEVFI